MYIIVKGEEGMSNIVNIIKKELLRVLKDKRLCFTTIIMPGLMIFIMYTLVGNVMNKTYNSNKNQEYKIVADGIPDEIAKYLSDNEFSIKEKSDDKKYYLKKIKEKKLDLYIVFDNNFEKNILSKNNDNVPNISIYYNSQNNTSNNGYIAISSFLDSYKDSVRNVFFINSENEKYDLATAKDSTGQVVSMILPMLLMTILFSICGSVAPDSIAGEKERGTMATLLVTPIKREELVIGKVSGLSVIVVLGGISSFIGAMLSLPYLSMGEDGIDTSVYSLKDYLGLFIIVISTVLVMISLASVISVMAKSVKEASSSMAPLTILIAVIGISGMYNQNEGNRLYYYLIPLYNSAKCMNNIFSFKYNVLFIIMTAISNIVYTLIIVFILFKLFKNENVIL